jgi:uncharacterized membrane protein YbhN (UPF0104 family)
VADVEVAGERAPSRPGGTSQRVVRVLLPAVVVVVVFAVVLPRVADLSEVWEQVRAMTGIELTSLLVLGVWNLASYALVYQAALPGLSVGRALLVTEASTAVANTVPAGAGFGIGVTWTMLASWGFRRPEITLLVLVTGVWNIFAKLALPVAALAIAGFSGETTTGSVAAAAAGVACLAGAVVAFTVLLRSEAGARSIGAGAARAVSALRRLVRLRPVTGWDEAAVDFRSSTTELLRVRWVPLTLATLVSHLSLFAVLLLSLRHVGVSEDEVSSAAALAGFAFVRLVSALPITPGGLGVVELGLTAALVAAGGEREPVLAAVLVYRAITYLLPIPAGGLSLVLWRRWRGPTGGQVATVEPSSSAP